MANMAETPELAGAEAYMLQKVSDLQNAERFLSMIERFKERATQHGATIEANTSGGNKMRGLYNITLKSLGAAAKRHPDQSLDFAIEYSEPMRRPGFYFMDSPGLDLESIAGQVASGCNLILFVTGNGSVTNFPFVPTIKIVSTSERFQMLSDEMDVNAGRYLEGYSMNDLGRETAALMFKVASGLLTKGEKAGHSQVQIWRNWQKGGQIDLEKLSTTKEFSGKPMILPKRAELSEIPGFNYHVIRSDYGYASKQYGLILPTSLCSSEVARIAAERLNNAGYGRDRGLSRFVAPGHTEGCASSTGLTNQLFSRVMMGYACHPLVRHCLFLEHGCEVTHNDYFKHFLNSHQVDSSRFGWASVQLDGGLEEVTRKIGSWFLTALINETAPQYDEVGLESLRLGIHTIGEMADTTAETLEKIARVIVSAGGSVVVSDRSSLFTKASFLEEPFPTLAHGQQFAQAGLHVMETQSEHGLETLTGLGATGVEIILVYSGRIPIQGHEVIPILHIATESDALDVSLADYDLILHDAPATWSTQVLEKIVAVLAQRYTTKSQMLGNTGFQITRGLMGLSF
jgi:altronate dehydratase